MCRPSPRRRCPASRWRCIRPARAGRDAARRSSSDSTRSSTPCSPPTKCASALRSKAPSRSRAPPEEYARRYRPRGDASGRRSLRRSGCKGGMRATIMPARMTQPCSSQRPRCCDRARRVAGHGPALSQQADHAGHSAAAGRHQRHHGARRRRQAQRALGQQVVIENRAAGGSGTVGTRQVAQERA